jgi:hypothetical protein
MRRGRGPAAFLILALAAVSVVAGCAAEVPVPVPAEASASLVVVSYFHRTIRCETCLKFEALTERALRDAFADELASGRLEWRVADFEEPWHEGDVAKYDIFESALIVSRFVGANEVEWKKLDAIWDLVGDDQVFIQYIQGEVGAYLGGAPNGQ